MRKLWTIATLLASQLAFTQQALAQAQQDVIYKKDGSVLRGTLIEQDFQTGRYKIQLAGGSIFAVSKDEIIKISKEAALNSTASNADGVHINIANNPSITQTPSQTLQQTPTLQTYGHGAEHAIENRHSIRFGSLSKDITDSDDNGISLSGINVAYQYNISEHLAFYAEYNKADFDGLIIDGDDYANSAYDYSYGYTDPYSSIYDDLSYYGYEASAMLSTNNYQGWQFYAGLGLFNEKFRNYGESQDVSGTVVTLGMGYSWQTVQLQLRASGHDSNDYGDDRSSSNLAMQLGFNY
ncbi:MAG: hypothetical protein RPR40_00905 [Bermanella sp.]